MKVITVGDAHYHPPHQEPAKQYFSNYRFKSITILSFLFFFCLFGSENLSPFLKRAIMLHHNFLLQSNYPNFKLTEKIKKLQKRKIQI